MRPALLLTCFLALGLAAGTAAGTSGTNCRRGTESGAWQLPDPQMSNGLIDGKLFGPAGNSVLQFQATLTDVVSPCLSCIEGRIEGTLDDGSGSFPDYLVIGTYRGNFLSRQGAFTALIYPYGSLTATGKMQGRFSDPYTDPDVPGQFRGTWVICR